LGLSTFHTQQEAVKPTDGLAPSHAGLARWKSVTGIVVPGHLHFFATIGAVSMAEIGPLLYLFTLSLFNSGFKLSAKDYLHFLPGLLVLVVMLSAKWQFLNISYYLFTAHFFFYLFLTWIYILKNKEQFRPDDLKWKWANYVCLG